MSKKSKEKNIRSVGCFPHKNGKITKKSWREYELQWIDWEQEREDHYYLDSIEAEVADMKAEMRDERDEL